MATRALCGGLVFAVLTLAGTFLEAQRTNSTVTNSVPTGWDSKPNGIYASREGATIHVKVTDENKAPLKQQALIRLTGQSTGRVVFQTTKDSKADFPNMPIDKYLLEVGAAGFLGMHEQISLVDIGYDATEQVMLARDPAAVDLTLRDAADLPSKARKFAEKGVQALQLSNFQEARRFLEAADHHYSDSSSVKFLLGYLALQQNDLESEQKYLSAAVKLNSHNLQAQNLLGQLHYRKGDYAPAVDAEEAVIAVNGNSAIARRVLANSYLRLNKYEKARENAQWIVDRGGSEGAGAKLVLGQAQAGLGHDQDAIATLKAFLEAEPNSKAAPQIREQVSLLEKRVSGGTGVVSLPTVLDDAKVADGESYASNAGMPADIDSHKPPVVASVQCPANLLDMAAQRSEELVDNVAQFSAIEDMTHESLTPQGTPRNREMRKFNYLVSITEPPTGTLVIQEFRDSAGGVLDMPEQITTTGLAVLGVAFHPNFSDGFEMKCEGLGDWDGQSAWIVHFRQKDDKPARLRTYVVNGGNYPVKLKGRAWFAADSYQLLHMETDLVHPLPEIHLMTEHTSVSYGPVNFKKSNTDLWLPKNADLYVHFAKHRFHRSENFDHFMLFATDAVDKPNLPKSDANKAAPTPHGGGPNQN